MATDNLADVSMDRAPIQPPTGESLGESKTLYAFPMGKEEYTKWNEPTPLRKLDKLMRRMDYAKLGTFASRNIKRPCAHLKALNWSETQIFWAKYRAFRAATKPHHTKLGRQALDRLQILTAGGKKLAGKTKFKVIKFVKTSAKLNKVDKDEIWKVIKA